MSSSRSKRKIIFAALLLFFGAFLVFGADFALAQTQQRDNLGLGFGAETGLPTNDVRSVTARLITVFLGLLGTICVVLILYAGYMWMTAAGQEERIKKAKQILSGAIIGLVIILSSYAITRFVVINVQRQSTLNNQSSNLNIRCSTNSPGCVNVEIGRQCIIPGSGSRTPNGICRLTGNDTNDRTRCGCERP